MGYFHFTKIHCKFMKICLQLFFLCLQIVRKKSSRVPVQVGSVFQKNGCVMVKRTALEEMMRMAAALMNNSSKCSLLSRV